MRAIPDVSAGSAFDASSPGFYERPSGFGAFTFPRARAMSIEDRVPQEEIHAEFQKKRHQQQRRHIVFLRGSPKNIWYFRASHAIFPAPERSGEAWYAFRTKVAIFFPPRPGFDLISGRHLFRRSSGGKDHDSLYSRPALIFPPNRIAMEDGRISELGGYARLASLIGARRSSNRGGTVLVDAGDFSMGTLFHTVTMDAAPELRLMALMGYDVITSEITISTSPRTAWPGSSKGQDPQPPGQLRHPPPSDLFQHGIQQSPGHGSRYGGCAPQARLQRLSR